MSLSVAWMRPFWCPSAWPNADTSSCYRDVCTGTAPSIFVTPTATPTVVSYVPNSFFPYPFMATSFANSAACLSAVSQCGVNYAACTSDLEGSDAANGYGVTIVVPGGGGVTVSPAQGTTVGTTGDQYLLEPQLGGVQGPAEQPVLYLRHGVRRLLRGKQQRGAQADGRLPRCRGGGRRRWAWG